MKSNYTSLGFLIFSDTVYKKMRNRRVTSPFPKFEAWLKIYLKPNYNFQIWLVMWLYIVVKISEISLSVKKEK